MDLGLLPLPVRKPLTLAEREQILEAAERRNMVERDVEYVRRMLDQWRMTQTILPIEIHFPDNFGVDVGETVEASARISISQIDCERSWMESDIYSKKKCIDLQINDAHIAWVGGCYTHPEQIRTHHLQLSRLSSVVLHIHDFYQYEENGLQPFSVGVKMRCEANHDHCYVGIKLSLNLPRIIYPSILQSRLEAFLLKDLLPIILEYLSPRVRVLNVPRFCYYMMLGGPLESLCHLGKDGIAIQYFVSIIVDYLLPTQISSAQQLQYCELEDRII